MSLSAQREIRSIHATWTINKSAIINTVTYLLTPWSTVLLEKLTGSQLVKKFPAFYGTRKFITVLTCPYPEPDLSSPCPHIPFPKDAPRLNSTLFILYVLFIFCLFNHYFNLFMSYSVEKYKLLLNYAFRMTWKVAILF